MKDKSQVLAGLTNYSNSRDPITRLMVPAIPNDPGIIHALRPTVSPRPILEPHFIEHTEDYRAAICGAQIKVVLPLSFKPDEDGACPECAEELRHNAPIAATDPGGSMPIFEKPGGDDWWSRGGLKHPGYARRREAERARRDTRNHTPQ